MFSLIERACSAGLPALQLREKRLPPRDLYALAKQVREITALHGTRLFINDRVDVALALDCDGVHLGQNSLPVGAARKLLPPTKLIGASTHSLAEAQEVEREGADFIVFGPVYPTPSKAAYGPPLGLDSLKQVAQAVTLPVFAIGGVEAERAAGALSAGAHGVAVIRALWRAADLEENINAFLSLTSVPEER